MNETLERKALDPVRFRDEVVSQYRPQVLRGVVDKWPAVAKGRQSAEAFCAYLAAFDSGKPVDVLRMPPSAHGRIFYNDAIDGFNFTRDRAALSSVIRNLAREALEVRPAEVHQADRRAGGREAERADIKVGDLLGREEREAAASRHHAGDVV